MNLVELMSNPIVLLISFLLGVFSFIWGIYTHLANKEKKKISYIVNSCGIVRATKDIPEFKILYRGNAINDLTVTRVAMWNSCSRELNHTDIADIKPLTITSDDGTEILDARIIKNSNQSNNFTVNQKSSHDVEVQFDYMDKQDGIVVQILHTGSARHFSLSGLLKVNEDLSLSGSIKGGKLKKRRCQSSATEKLEYKIAVIGLIFNSLMCSLLITSIAITPVFERFGLVPSETLSELVQNITMLDPFVSVFCFVLYLLLAWTCGLLLKWTFHIDVPSALRDSIDIDVG